MTERDHLEITVKASHRRLQIHGREFDWFAIDANGHVGHFSTAGCGPIPVPILLHLDEAETLPARILELPLIGTAEGHISGRIDDWLEMARRGLHSFDAASGSYTRLATPSAALHVSALPAPVAEQLLRFERAVFAGLLEFDPRGHCACE